MDSPLLDSLAHLNIIEIVILAPLGVLMVYFLLSHRVSVLMFLLVLSAALVGVTVPVIEGVASLVRWLSVLILLFTGIFFSRIKIPYGLLLFWGYVFIGFVFVLRGSHLSWQIQRGLLLLIVATAIPFAFSNKSYKIFHSTLVGIGMTGVIFALMNFVALPTSLNDPLRFMGYAKIAPFFASTLGALLPFTFWGSWFANSKALRLVCGLGFLAGIVLLIISGQRAGTVAGCVSLIPFIFTTVIKRKNWIRSLFLVILLGIIAFFIIQSSTERIMFVLSRYSLEAGLSNRDLIWQLAISEISKNPLMGQGIGASEGIISSSFHNAYLEIWYNAGIIGLVLFLAAQVYFFYRLFHLYRIIRDPEKKSVVALALGYMLGFSVICIFESLGAGASNLNLILYLFIGVLISSNIPFKAAPVQIYTEGYTTASSSEMAALSVVR